MIKVVKVGGAVIENERTLMDFCRDFSALEGRKLLVHGGSSMASALQRALGNEPVKIEGRRVTDAGAIKAVTMAYSGWCNKRLTACLQSLGCNAVGLSGCDGNVICSSRRPPLTLTDGKTVVDYGFVGQVTVQSVNVPFLEMLLDAGCTPVLCAINHDGAGQLLNTNADTIASCVASALRGQLVYCFELDGVLRDVNDPDSVIPSLSKRQFESMIASGSVSDGMIPKITNCLYALENGAAAAVIKNARDLDNPCAGTSISL